MKRPIGITIISILNFISGIYLFLIGLGLTSGAGYGFFGKAAVTAEEKSGFLGVGIYGIVALIFGILTIMVASALWRLKTWAWYLAFLITAFNLANSLYSGYKNGFTTDVIIHSVAYGLLALYFLAVKKHFGKPAN
jgi:hypothetical protein